MASVPEECGPNIVILCTEVVNSIMLLTYLFTFFLLTLNRRKKGHSNGNGGKKCF